MNKTLVTLAALCTLSLSLAAQTPINPNAAQGPEQPQIAYRLFSHWADNYEVEAEKGQVVAESILFGTGALCLAGSATTWFAGDAISTNLSGSPMDPEGKNATTIALGIAGGACTLSGIIVALAPIKDYRAIYSDVFAEQDPEVREAMAVSALRYQADRGKEGRIRSFFMGFAVPLIAAGITAGVNAAEGRDWDRGLWQTVGNSSWAMAGSIFSLFQKSPEERLYDRYLAAREAYYSSAK
jgi:hypothetical protein